MSGNLWNYLTKLSWNIFAPEWSFAPYFLFGRRHFTTKASHPHVTTSMRHFVNASLSQCVTSPVRHFANASLRQCVTLPQEPLFVSPRKRVTSPKKHEPLSKNGVGNCSHFAGITSKIGHFENTCLRNRSLRK